MPSDWVDKSKKVLEIVLVTLTLLSVLNYTFYFYGLLSPNQDDPFDPFKEYNNNSGIIKISFANLIASISFIACFLLLRVERFKLNKKILATYLLAALVIAFLQWFELYYGSTFYYGEVRDKQGIMFPGSASLMLTLVIWKIRFAEVVKYDLTSKLILTALVNVGLCILWTQVYELWDLWQS